MSQNQNFFVATAIPYVNAQPHLGHALLFTYGDVLARYGRSLGKEVVFSIGTDEHGIKIAEQAANQKVTPQVLADQVSQRFRQAADKLAVSYTHFIRTSDSKHRQAVQQAWQQLQQQGYIYKDFYDGWYCRGCEAHRTPTVVEQHQGICPDHNRDYERIKEENYFFKLSHFKQEIKARIASDEIRIIPDSAKLEALNMLDAGGGEDFSISRPAAVYKWGIAVPGDEEHIIYVWLDALLNYITVLGYPDGSLFKSHWPAQMQVIGRDILRFHAIYWPAFLLGLGLPLYQQLYVHSLITVEGRKMSKSLGNTVDPFTLIDNYGLDAFRYYFLRHMPSYSNGNYQHQHFVDAYNHELVDQLGNLAYRLQALIHQKLAGKLPQTAQAVLQRQDGKAFYQEMMADCRFDQALNFIFSEVKALNRQLETSSPWLLNDKGEVTTILDQLSANLRALLDLLQPFLPSISQRLTAIFEANPLPRLEQPPLVKISES